MKLKQIFTISLLFFVTLVSSQNIVDRTIDKADSMMFKYRHTRANKNFENMAYVKAINKYEKLLEKGYESDSLKRYLATAYYNVGNTRQAEPLFRSVAVRDSGVSARDIYLFAQTLKYNKKYRESDKWIAEYRKIKGDDSRSVIQYEAAPKISEITNVKRYRVKTVNFNSKQADFGAVVLGKKIIFATARNNEKIVNREYAWNETPYLDIYSSKREGGSFFPPKLLSTRFSSSYHDGPAAFNSTGEEIFFTRNCYVPVMPHTNTKVVEHVEVLNKILPKKGVSGTTHLMIQYSKKDALGQWKYPETLAFCSPNYSCGHPCLAPDDSTLYFASDMPGGYGGTDIYYVTRTYSGWSEPVNLGADINTEGDEMFPFVHSNGYLYFSSNGQLSIGGLDIFVANKTPKGYFVKNMGVPLNTNRDDFSFFLEDNNETGYIASNRPGGLGDDDIYRFSILKPIQFGIKLNVTVADSADGHFLNKAEIALLDENGSVLTRINTGRDHAYQFDIEHDIKYYVEVKREDYYAKTAFVLSTEYQVIDDAISLPIKLRKQPFYGIYGKVFLLPLMEPISEVDLELDAYSGADSSLVSDENGFFRTKLRKDTKYDLVFRKKNFFTKRVSYTTAGKDTGYVNINEYIPSLGIEKVELGKSIEIEILYDLGKWNIREDAAKELDDMVLFLQENPDISIELGSHTDARGSARSNQILSQKRAESAVNYIVENGISSDRISAKGYGETRLKNRCADGVRCTEEEHQANRRSEAKITGM